MGRLALTFIGLALFATFISGCGDVVSQNDQNKKAELLRKQAEKSPHADKVD